MRRGSPQRSPKCTKWKPALLPLSFARFRLRKPLYQAAVTGALQNLARKWHTVRLARGTASDCYSVLLSSSLFENRVLHNLFYSLTGPSLNKNIDTAGSGGNRQLFDHSFLKIAKPEILSHRFSKESSRPLTLTTSATYTQNIILHLNPDRISIRHLSLSGSFPFSTSTKEL